MVDGAAPGGSRSREQLERLQRLLLPATLPTVGCTEVAVEYRSHNHELELGGDWYDLIDRSDHQVVAVVGDVVGHGLEQISVMGQLRAAANALARVCVEPHELLSALDRFAAGVPGATMATVAVLMLDGSTTARLTSAGHPPLLRITTDGVVEVVHDGRRPPLAVDAPGAHTATFEYRVDDLLVLFTDGLVERRAVDYDEAIEALGSLVAARRGESCTAIAAAVVDALGADADDDIALMVMRPRNHRAPGFLLEPQAAPTVRIR